MVFAASGAPVRHPVLERSTVRLLEYTRDDRTLDLLAQGVRGVGLMTLTSVPFGSQVMPGLPLALGQIGGATAFR